ncbi:hypothetical protein BpHYR1_038346 [Brachionus plicatilis]|uniref:Uncharacterized protein n=1 Tax=Brachionus plicatilis TaxID=10195 RepID=A0A3M7RDU7_BRAPC|nr:hypothetical protein BpHYR1_038346 [Brachionus plicatilis]
MHIFIFFALINKKNKRSSRKMLHPEPKKYLLIAICMLQVELMLTFVPIVNKKRSKKSTCNHFLLFIPVDIKGSMSFYLFRDDFKNNFCKIINILLSFSSKIKIPLQELIQNLNSA